jgi:acyl-CoA reductase-like NAD-dependent aldehyde dehydrogenase
MRRHKTVIDPATLGNEGVFSRTECEIDAVLTAATKAQAAWKKLDAKSRATILHRRQRHRGGRLADTLRRADVARDGQALSGSDRRGRQLRGAFRYFAEMARDDAGKVAGTTQAGSFQYARYERYGVSVHIMPFNFPILLMCWTVAASLASGNACIIKPAEATTLSTLDYMTVFRSLPEGLVSCVPGGAATASGADRLRTHPCRRLHRLGRRRQGGGGGLRRTHEAVRHRGRRQRSADHQRNAPLDVAAAGSVTAAFHLSGQVCTSAERFLRRR